MSTSESENSGLGNVRNRESYVARVSQFITPYDSVADVCVQECSCEQHKAQTSMQDNIAIYNNGHHFKVHFSFGLKTDL